MLTAQSQNCTNPVNNTMFEGFRNQVQQQATTMMALQRGREIARNNCFSATQARELILLFIQDNHKAEIGRLIYLNVVDKNNFAQVYDFFTNAPALASLARYVQDVSLPPAGQPDPLQTISRDNVVLPVYDNYRGRRIGNQQPISSAQFAQFKSSIMNPNPYVQLQKAMSPDRTRFYSLAQVMDLALLFNEENQRLSILQHYVTQTIDIDHHPYALQLLTTAANKTAYLQNVQYFAGNGNPNNPNNPNNPGVGNTGCFNPITEADLATMKTTLERSRISSVRNKQYKAIVKGKCFTTAQIKTLVLLFNNFDRLDLLKYSYEYCSDQQNYYSLSEVLVSSSDVESFAEFLQSK